MIFTLSDEELHIERITFTVFDALAKTGGIVGSIMGVFQIIMIAIEDMLMY
jgi:hypothetical protein